MRNSREIQFDAFRRFNRDLPPALVETLLGNVVMGNLSLDDAQTMVDAIQNVLTEFQEGMTRAIMSELRLGDGL